MRQCVSKLKPLPRTEISYDEKSSSWHATTLFLFFFKEVAKKPPGVLEKRYNIVISTYAHSQNAELM